MSSLKVPWHNCQLINIETGNLKRIRLEDEMDTHRRDVLVDRGDLSFYACTLVF